MEKKVIVSKIIYLLIAVSTLILPYFITNKTVVNSLPGVAIILGVVFVLIVGNPFIDKTQKLTSPLLGMAIVGMGFGMNLITVLKVGASGFFYTLVGISLGMFLGILLGKRLKLTQNSMLLISAGTSICGGSAIAAVAPVLKAKSHDIALSTATVFILNGIALLIFPYIGHQLDFDQTQFGTWAALAIHDTSSVVGASMAYGEEALVVGTTIKMARALWIVPLTLFISAYVNRRAVEGQKEKFKIKVPWFIPGFLVAALIVTYLPNYVGNLGSVVKNVGGGLNTFSKHLMILTLFLIGSNLSLGKIKELGVRPFLHGIILWLILSVIWATSIYFKWIS